MIRKFSGLDPGHFMVIHRHVVEAEKTLKLFLDYPEGLARGRCVDSGPPGWVRAPHTCSMTYDDVVMRPTTSRCQFCGERDATSRDLSTSPPTPSCVISFRNRVTRHREPEVNMAGACAVLCIHYANDDALDFYAIERSTLGDRFLISRLAVRLVAVEMTRSEFVKICHFSPIIFTTPEG